MKALLFMLCIPCFTFAGVNHDNDSAVECVIKKIDGCERQLKKLNYSKDYANELLSEIRDMLEHIYLSLEVCQNGKELDDSDPQM